MQDGRADIEADYVIVGAGSAGCVLANRLSADPRNKVVLLEAGGDDRVLKEPGQIWGNMNIRIPAGWANTNYDPKVAWLFKSKPTPSTGDRVFPYPRGKVLGGSSAINGLIYVRGLASDYNGWRQMGCEGWSWEDVEPYFERAEDRTGAKKKPGNEPGPLKTTFTPTPTRTMDALIDAFDQYGVPRVKSINEGIETGACYAEFTSKGGRRQSTAVAYLHPVRNRPNLRIETRAEAQRINFDGREANGVTFLQNGVKKRVSARREVILAGGVINSPQLLELSGVGGGQLLSSMGIPTIFDNPEVGEKFHDHYASVMRGRLKPDAPSLNAKAHGIAFVGQLLRYALTGGGLLATGATHTMAFAKSHPDLDMADLHIFAMPASADIEKMAIDGNKMAMEREPGISMSSYQMRPRSRGSVHIQSPDPTMQPAIMPNFLTDPTDIAVAIGGVRVMRNVLSQPAMQPFLDHETPPLAGCETDEQILDMIKMSGFSSYHPVGSCRMSGRDDGVVDSRLRVRGVSRLRVVDASIMPQVVSANTNAASIMIGEKGSDLILADHR